MTKFNRYNSPPATVSDLKGVTLLMVTGMDAGNDDVIFRAEDGRVWRMCHYQDCCESVAITEVHGDPNDLVGVPILHAEESTNYDDPSHDYSNDSHTWTFYRFTTIKGSVTLRWLGESNGYYSESVGFHLINDGKEG